MAVVKRRRLLVNPARRRKNGLFGGRKKKAAAKRHRKNPVLTLVGNPRRKRKTVARTKKRSIHHRRKRRNPAAIAANPVAFNPRRRRRNPGGAKGILKGTIGLLPQAGILIGGAVGSRMLTQAVLGSNNKGIMGYGAHIVATAGMAALAGKFAGTNGAFMASLGGAVSLLLRLIGDFTPLGQRLSLVGLGDYQMTTIFSPKRYVNALQSAEVEMPLALQAPRVAAPTPAPPPNGVGRRTLYSKRSMYS
jgi:hypothetical protein